MSLFDKTQSSLFLSMRTELDSVILTFKQQCIENNTKTDLEKENSILFIQECIEIKYTMIYNIILILHRTTKLKTNKSSVLDNIPKLNWGCTQQKWGKSSTNLFSDQVPILIVEKKRKWNRGDTNKLLDMSENLFDNLSTYLDNEDIHNMSQLSKPFNLVYGQIEWLNASYMRSVNILLDVINIINVFVNIDNVMKLDNHILIPHDLIEDKNGIELCLSESMYKLYTDIQSHLKILNITPEKVKQLKLLNEVQNIKQSRSITYQFRMFDFKNRFDTLTVSLNNFDFLEVMSVKNRRTFFSNPSNSYNNIAELMLHNYLEISQGVFINRLSSILKDSYNEKERSIINHDMLISATMYSSLESVVFILEQYPIEKQRTLAWPDITLEEYKHTKSKNVSQNNPFKLYLDDHPLLYLAINNFKDIIEWNPSFSMEWINYFYSNKFFHTPKKIPPFIRTQHWDTTINELEQCGEKFDVVDTLRNKLKEYELKEESKCVKKNNELIE